jgi:PAS domain S-box-containing protein
LPETIEGGFHEMPVKSSAILDALPRAVIVTDETGVIVQWNAMAEQLYGWAPNEVIGRSVFEVVVPVNQRAAGEQIMEGVRAGEPWEGDFTVLRRDGEPVRVWVANSPILDGDGKVVAVVGASEDVTEQRLLEQQAVDLTQHLQLALDAGGLGTFRWDMATGITTWDTKLESLFGLPPGGFDGTFDAWVALLHPDDRDAVLRALDDAIERKGQYVVEHRVVWPDGTVHWLQGFGRATIDGAGAVTGTIGCTTDITDRVLLDGDRQRLTLEALEAADRERAHRERLEFLGQINDALAGSRTRSDVMRSVVAAAVPRLGDWCAIHVLPTNESIIPEVDVAHIDPAMVAYAHELRQRFPYDPNAPKGVAAVIRTGIAEFYPEITDDLLDELDASDEARTILEQLALRSAITVPLVKRGLVMGAVQFVMTSSRRRYTEEDFAMAKAVAARVASALDNIRLSEHQREIAATLQASLLPAQLPTMPGVDLAVRYWAAGEGIDVGGDFYDVIAVNERDWAVVVGDVCGTGPTAAAITGLARHTIASAAWLGHDAAGVLRHLNTTLRRRDFNAFLTVAYGELTPSATGMDLRLALGGHPLPVVVRADGQAAAVGRSGTLIGVFDDVTVEPSEIQLLPGDTLVLYTDGVTDVAPPHGLTSERLLELVGAAVVGTKTADDVADRIRDAIAEVLPISLRTDDIALLVLRLA